MNQQFTQVLQKLYTSRKHLLVFVDDEEYEEFEYLKSVKGNFFGIVLMNQQYTQVLQTLETRRKPLLVWWMMRSTRSSNNLSL